MYNSLAQKRSFYLGYIKSPSFDAFFILGVFSLAMVAGFTADYFPEVAQIIIILNIWLIGYHHVISTYTRLCFDKYSYNQSKTLMFGGLALVVLIVFMLSQYIGIWVLLSIYLYAQWFHYSRQSWGIARAYERNAGDNIIEDRGFITQVAFYSFPTWGILYRSWQAPDSFLGIQLRVIPVSYELVFIVGSISILFLFLWIIKMVRLWWNGQLPVAYVAFMLSHFAVFYFGYIGLENIDSGWLVINLWHSLQYILFVWLFNNRTYNGKEARNGEKFISMISQNSKAWFYFGFCLLVTFLIYGLVSIFIDISLDSGWMNLSALAITVIVYQTINFHHYFVDAFIWRAKWIKKRG